MFFCAALVLLFIIKLRFPKGKNIHHKIETRYGRPLLNLFRNSVTVISYIFTSVEAR